MFEITKRAPQNIKSICYEKKLNDENYIDILASYNTCNYNLDALSRYFNHIDENKYSQRVIKFIEKLKVSQFNRPIKSLWLSFDKEDDNYSLLPTFYYSTQHSQFREVNFIKKNIIEACKILAPEYLHNAYRIVNTTFCCSIMHLGFTYGRKSFRLKFTIKLLSTEIIDFLKSIGWAGHYDKLKDILHTFNYLLPLPQVSISFQDEIINKIEIEFPWIADKKGDYNNKKFQDNVGTFCDINELKIQNLFNWYTNNANAALYLKMSLSEDSSVNLKAYLHTQKSDNNFLSSLKSVKKC